MIESFKHCTKFNNGSIVKHVMCEDEVGMITGITIRPNNSVIYAVTWEDSLTETNHYEIELALAEKKITA